MNKVIVIVHVRLGHEIMNDVINVALALTTMHAATFKTNPRYSTDQLYHSSTDADI